MNKGFTLIELLIVIAVIGILAAVILIIIDPLKRIGQTRDAQRRTDLRTLANALEDYAITHGRYPITGPSTWYQSEPYIGPPDTTYGPANNGDWIPGLVASGTIKRLPKDPKGGLSTLSSCGVGGYRRAYNYRSDDGSCYKLLSHCGPEATQMNDTTDPFRDPIRSAYSWMVCSPSGSACCSH